MSNAIAVVNSNVPSTDIMSVMGDLGIGTSDLVIPTVAMMQNTSEKVGMGEASFGDLINSQTGEKLGDFNNAMEILPLKLTKSWVVYDMSGSLPKYLRVEPMTPANERLPWEGVENGVKIRRDMSYDFYVISAKDVANEEVFPFVVRFRRTSLAAGKTLATLMMKNAMMGKEPFFKTVNLKPSRQKAETNVYAVYTVAPSRVATPEEKSAATLWLNLMKVKTVKSDEETAIPQETVASPVEVKTSKKTTDLY